MSEPVTNHGVIREEIQRLAGTVVMRDDNINMLNLTSSEECILTNELNNLIAKSVDQAIANAKQRKKHG